MLIDTTFLIDLMRGDGGAVSKATELEENLVQQRVSSMTLFELFYGVARSDQPNRERRTVEEVITSKPIEPADAAVMKRSGRVAGDLSNEGTPISDADVIIGATAIGLDESVLTRNVEDFERLGVAIEEY